MHELAVTENLLEVALRHGSEAGAVRIRAIHLVVGSLSSIVDESVQFYWDIVAQGTIAEGAALRFRRTAPAARCLDCGRDLEVPSFDALCPHCGGARLALVGGDELHLEAMDIETEQNGAGADCSDGARGATASLCPERPAKGAT